MAVMTTQQPLPLIPAEATEISAAAAMIEDAEGCRVYVHGNLCFAWNAGDIAGRRFAAVSLMRTKAATQTQVAAAFEASPLTVWRWDQALSAAGVPTFITQPALDGLRGAELRVCGADWVDLRTKAGSVVCGGGLRAHREDRLGSDCGPDRVVVSAGFAVDRACGFGP